VQAVVLREQHRRAWSLRGRENVESCSKLTNQLTHYTVEIDVGTPPQKFDVVADTGSNNVIVQSCLCREITEECVESEKCFVGTNKSSTFVGPEANASLVKMTFGSGDIIAVVATDVVSVGKVRAIMDKGLMLMVKRELAMSQNFEGILGLGVPSWADPLDASSKPAGRLANETFKIPQFLEAAAVDTFSICFRADGDGALRLNPPTPIGMLKQVGRRHWSLSLEGFSVGSATMPVSVCHPESKQADSVSPCAAIPDSGTTHILGPGKDIDQIFADTCTRWPRCEKFKSEQNLPSEQAFQQVLYKCQDWMTEKHGLGEVPSMFVHLKSADGETQVLELTAMSFVFGTLTAEGNTVCYPSFSAFDFPTRSHGPAWILGTPLFFEYQVAFGLRIPSLAFSKTPCELCAGSANPLLMNTTLTLPVNRPRMVHGRPRFPDIDISEEL